MAFRGYVCFVLFCFFSWEVRTLFLKKKHILFLHKYTTMTFLEKNKNQCSVKKEQERMTETENPAIAIVKSHA